MEPCATGRTSDSRRRAVRDGRFGLDLVSPEPREKIGMARVTPWSSGPHQDPAARRQLAVPRPELRGAWAAPRRLFRDRPRDHAEGRRRPAILPETPALVRPGV